MSQRSAALAQWDDHETHDNCYSGQILGQEQSECLVRGGRDVHDCAAHHYSPERASFTDYPSQSPRGGNQFFGHTNIAADGRLTLSLRDLTGAVLWPMPLESDT